MTQPEGGNLTVNDFKQLLFELYLAQRHASRLQSVLLAERQARTADEGGEEAA